MELEEKNSILLTFDIEDWFQVENFKAYIKFSTWNSFELRVEKNTHKILALLDQHPFKPKATFFTLGWVAKKLPGLVKEIAQQGHEIASHGVNHHLCKKIESKELLNDLKASKSLLQDLTGRKIHGFRAPSFAIDNDIVAAVEQAGYQYDSSFNSFAGHGRYGTIDLSSAVKKGASYQFKKDFFELPISNFKCFNKIIPLGGGGYFRLYPFVLFKHGMTSILNKDHAFVFYSHPWEFDPEQPRVLQASRSNKFKHYVNLHHTEKKLNALIDSFAHCNFLTCRDYIKKNGNTVSQTVR